jgi:hypothetical protein
LKQHNPPEVAKKPVTSPGQQSVGFAVGSPAGMHVVPATQRPSSEQTSPAQHISPVAQDAPAGVQAQAAASQ